MSNEKNIKSALISVFSKNGLEPIVKELDKQGVTIYSTGGTEKFINDLFDITKIDTTKEFYKKYLQYIDKYDIIPNTKQISFSIQCKNVIK